jgi:hypothetical protein
MRGRARAVALLRPNQAQSSSPMVWGWRLCTWFGRTHTTYHGRGQSRYTPWLRRKTKIIYSQTGLNLVRTFCLPPMFVSITLFRREETVSFLCASHPETLHIKTGKGTFFRARKVCFCVFVLEKNRLWTHSNSTTTNPQNNGINTEIMYIFSILHEILHDLFM